MARYIDAEKADVESISCFYGSECRIEDVQEWLDEQPTADVVEVKHGEWFEVDDGIDIGSGKHLECSICGKWKKDRIKSNYCPNCGADMRGAK